MKKRPETFMNAWPVIVGVIVIILTAFYVAVGQVQSPDKLEDKTTAMEEQLPPIDDAQGLEAVREELDESNPDDLDAELMELEQDTAAF